MKFLLVFLLSITSLGLKSQNLTLTDSFFTVIPITLNPSAKVESTVVKHPDSLLFELPMDFYIKHQPYSLIMIVEVEVFGNSFYQFEFGKGKGMKTRKSILLSQKGKFLLMRQHELKTY